MDRAMYAPGPLIADPKEELPFMDIPHKLQNIRKIGTPQSQTLLLCLFILFAVVFSAGYHQPLNANSTAAPEPAGIPPAIIEQPPEAKTAGDSDQLANTPSIWPASGPVSSGFGWRNPPIEGGSELHQGIDIASGTGIPVVATADGQVVKSGWSGGYGNVVQIDHGNGIETIYGHNAQVVVSAGQSVKKGQLISYAGSTGISTGPHVHYEVRENGTPVDPIKYLVLY